MKTSKPIFLSILIFLSSCFYQREKLNYSKYRKGAFLYHIQSLENQPKVKIIRDDSLQTEIVKNNGDTCSLKIAWVDSSTYTLKYLKIVSKDSNTLKLLNIGVTITTSIVDGTDDYYIFESSNDKNDFIFKDTIWIAN